MATDSFGVSVVVAAFNAERYLAEALESVLRQKYPPIEVNVVDDGSTDNTSAVAQSFASDSRVRYFRQDNGGQCAAKNFGIEVSTGEFVAFLDADDTWRTDKLERQMKLFDGRPDVGVVYGLLENIDDTGRVREWSAFKQHRGLVTEHLLIQNFVPFSSAVVRRELLERFGGFDPCLDMGIDYDLWLRLSLQCEFDFVPDVVGQYRVWSGQMSRKVRQRYEAGTRIMTSFLCQHGVHVDSRAAELAWAHTFVGRGNSLLWAEHDWRGAWADYLRAIEKRPLYWPAYRSMLRALVSRRAPR